MNNNAVIDNNNNYGRLQELILLFEIPIDTRKISSKFIDNFGTRPQKNHRPWCILTEAYPGVSLSYRKVSIQTTTGLFYNTSNQPEETTIKQTRRKNRT